jgi:ABC-type bacteriocin/lantibiotic exporter with double-glycine peptidase domain
LEFFMLKLARVEPYQQLTSRTCSAACLHAVLRHYDLDYEEPELEELIGVGRHGAEVGQIVKAAHALGLDAEEIRFPNLFAAKQVLDGDVPIIADMRSWNRPGQGHYTVLTKLADGTAEIMDPNTPGNWREISAPELKRRWWDWSMEAPHKLMRHAGVVVWP